MDRPRENQNCNQLIARKFGRRVIQQRRVDIQWRRVNVKKKKKGELLLGEFKVAANNVRAFSRHGTQHGRLGDDMLRRQKATTRSNRAGFATAHC